jgi:hypothetical protein
MSTARQPSHALGSHQWSERRVLAVRDARVLLPNIHHARLAHAPWDAQDGLWMDWSGFSVSVLAAAAMGGMVGVGAWVVLHWPEEGLRHAIHESPLDVAAGAVGLFLLGIAVLFFAVGPWGS